MINEYTMKRKLTCTIAVMMCALSAYATCTPLNESLLTNSLDCEAVNVSGEQTWYWEGSYGAKVSGYVSGATYANEDWIVTPAYDLDEATSASIEFEHAARYGNTANIRNEFTLWVSHNYTGDVSTATWSRIDITDYPSGTDWTFVKTTQAVPAEHLLSNTVFGFKYISDDVKCFTWEFRKLNIKSQCTSSGSGTDIGSSPVAIPDAGNGRLRVCGQNLRNYYYNYTESTRPDYNDEEGFNDKTARIVQSMLWLEADIYAFNELEACPEVLEHLAGQMNETAGTTVYTAVSDGINISSAEAGNNIKSGFIYRTDKVKPYKSNYAGSTQQYYKNTMRIQAFEELATNERFTLSMNHFKAKDSSSDQGNSMRVTNATRLLEALGGLWDPDVLIMGDLNCEYGEEPLTMIVNAGYAEQILRYNGNSAYSHCYNGGELIDHVFANPSMAGQITGVGLYHISTNCGANYPQYWEYKYSDHDPYIVGINLGIGSALENTEAMKSDAKKVMLDGRLYIIVGEAVYDVTGRKVEQQ